MTVSTNPLKTGVPGVNFIGTFTWASLAAVTTATTGSTAYVSDLNYSMFVYNGTRWSPLGGMAVIAQSGASGNTVTGTVAETTLASITIPGGLMGLNGGLWISGLFQLTSSANNKTLKVKHGTSVLRTVTTTTNGSWPLQIEINNRASQSSQVADPNQSASFALSSLDIATFSVDTSTDQTVVFTGTLTNTGESISIARYRIVLVA